MADIELIEQLRLYRDVANSTNGWAVVSSGFLDKLCRELDQLDQEEQREVVATYGRT